MEPDNAPYYPPGFVAYESTGNGLELIQNQGIFTVVDCKLRIAENFHTEVEYDEKSTSFLFLLILMIYL